MLHRSDGVKQPVARAVEKMVSQFIDNVYDKLKANIKENKFQSYDSWAYFIETNDVLDNLEDTVAEMEFE